MLTPLSSLTPLNSSLQICYPHPSLQSTNSFFQNFVLKNGDQPEYIHPYLIKSLNSSLYVSYPNRFSNSEVISQLFNPDFAITSYHEQIFYPEQISNYQQIFKQQTSIIHHFFNNDTTVSSFLRNSTDPFFSGTHKISSYNDLGVTLDIPSSKLRFFLVRGSPFLTFFVTQTAHFSITTIHAILSFSSDHSLTKYTFHLSNGQTWLLYASSRVILSHGVSEIVSDPFWGVIRIALLPDSNPRNKAVLDKCSSCYPVSGVAVCREQFGVEYKFEKRGSGDLSMLAHPLHLQLLSEKDCNIIVLKDFKYKSIDRELVGVVGDSCLLKTDHVSVTWHSSKGVREISREEIISALSKDVEGLNSSAIKSNSSYFYGKLIARAARLALIADGRNQESTSESVNAYYAAALIGMAYEDAELAATASTLTSLEILAAKTWWHVKEGGNMYEKVFSQNNKVIGVLWSNKRDSPAERKECRLGIQLLPLIPISEVLFSDVKYVKELVEWTLPTLKRDGAKEGWKGFVYALQGIYDYESALLKIRRLKGFDDGNSLTNLLWWIHSRG